MKVLLQLQKQQFDAGMKSVKASIQGLGRTIKQVSGMIVGGLGLGYLVSEMKNAARDMSVMKATMENVSNGFTEYAENIKFIQKISSDYGQDMIALGNGFAKFSAAAKQANISIEQQREIFEALTRAAGAYHLSADQTQLVSLALEQMMSKGTIRAEELVRQLGNNLPGAVNAMATAFGRSQGKIDGTVKELYDAMKAGNVVSKDVLPYFAQVLKVTTSAANFDSLQASLNRFKNSWVEFVDNSGFENLFKRLVDVGTRSLDSLKEHVDDMKSILVGAFAGVSTGKMFQSFQAEGTKSIKNLIAENELLEKQIQKVSDATKDARVGADAYDSAVKSVGKNLSIIQKNIYGITDEEWEAANAEYKRTGIHKELNKLQERYAKSINEVKAGEKEIQGLQDKIKENSRIISGSTDKFGKISIGIKNTFSAIWASIQSIGIALAAGLIIGAITAIAVKVIQIAKETARFKNLIKETDAEIEKMVSDTQKQVYEAQALFDTAKDLNASDKLRNDSAKKLLALLNDQKITIEDIKNGSDNVKTSLDNWSTSLLKAARSAAIFTKIQQLEDEMLDLEVKKREAQAKPQTYRPPIVGAGGGSLGQGAEVATQAARDVQTYQGRIDALNDTIEHYLDLAKEMGYENPFTDDAKAANTTEAVKTALDGYNTSLAELDKKLRNGSISLKKYNRDVNKLREDTVKNVQKYEGFEDAIEELGVEYEKLYKKINTVSNVGESPLEKLRKDIDKYLAKKKELDNLLSSGKIDEAGYLKSLGKLIEKYQGSIFGLDDLGDMLAKLGPKYQKAVDDINEAMAQVAMFDELEENLKEAEKQIESDFKEFLKDFEKYQDKLLEISNEKRPKRKARDTFFDYRSTGTQKLQGSADMSAKYVNDLEKFRDKILDVKDAFGYLDPYLQNLLTAICNKLAEATKQAKELDDAAKFAELKEDLEDLKRQRYNDLFEGIAGGGGFGALEHFHSSVSAIVDAMEELGDADSAWDAFGAGISVLTNFAQAIDSVISAIETWQNVIKTLTMLQEAQNTMQTAVSANKVASLAQEATAEGSSAAATVAAENAKQAAVATTSALLAGEAVAGAAASQASIPYVGPILAAAAAAAIAALLASSMKKFAKGGIVGGNDTQGDKNVVRANSGEMILTKGQQANLFAMINRGTSGGKEVEFRLRGSDLIGAINNTQRQRRG